MNNTIFVNQKASEWINSEIELNEKIGFHKDAAGLSNLLEHGTSLIKFLDSKVGSRIKIEDIQNMVPYALVKPCVDVLNGIQTHDKKIVKYNAGTHNYNSNGFAKRYIILGRHHVEV